MTLPRINLRSYDANDLESVIELFQSTVHIVNRADYTPKQLNAWAAEDQNRAYWTTKLEHHFTQLAWIEDQLAGFGTLSKKGLVDHLFVHKDKQRLGIGELIYLRLEFEAIQYQLDRLYTEASITAKPFFEEMGFEVIFPQEKDVRGVKLKNYVMEKRLN